MNTMSLSILKHLRNNVEGKEVDTDGKVWGLVYLENVGSGRKFAGHLSILSKNGLYRRIDSEFGEVLIEQ